MDVLRHESKGDAGGLHGEETEWMTPQNGQPTRVLGSAILHLHPQVFLALSFDRVLPQLLFREGLSTRKPHQHVHPIGCQQYGQLATYEHHNLLGPGPHQPMRVASAMFKCADLTDSDWLCVYAGVFHWVAAQELRGKAHLEVGQLGQCRRHKETKHLNFGPLLPSKEIKQKWQAPQNMQPKGPKWSKSPTTHPLASPL